MATILPAVTKDLGGLALYGWAFSAFMLTNLLGITVGGAEADRQGPAGPFLVGVVLFALGLAVAGLAPTMLVVIAGRAVQGLGAGVISAVAYAAIGYGYAEAAQPRMLALISSAWVVPGLVGPAVAGLIADHGGWRWIFLGLAPLCPLAAGLAVPALRRIHPVAPAPRDWKRMGNAVRLAAGTGVLVAALGLTSPLLAIALVVPGAALALSGLRPLLPAGTLRAAPGLPAAIATNGLLSLGFFGVDAFVPLALIAARGQRATVAGLALTAATLCWAVGAWLQAHYAAQQSRRRMVLAGLAITTVGIAGVTAVLSPHVPVPVAVAAWGAAGLGVGLAFSTLTLSVLECAPAGEEGSATAALQLANVLGIALGAGVGGVIVAAASQERRPPAGGIMVQDLLMLVLIGLAALAALRLPGKRQRDSAHETSEAVVAVGER